MAGAPSSCGVQIRAGRSASVLAGLLSVVREGPGSPTCGPTVALPGIPSPHSKSNGGV